MSYYRKTLIRNGRRIKSATFDCVDRLDFYKQVTRTYRQLSFGSNRKFCDWNLLFVIQYACISYTYFNGIHIDRMKIEFDYVDKPFEIEYE